MPKKNDMTGGTIYISSADGKVWQVFEGIKEASLECADAIDNFSQEYRNMLIGSHCEFTATAKLPKETMALLLGFKNYNCYSRFIRRRKRHAEQERRRRLKEGSFHA